MTSTEILIVTAVLVLVLATPIVVLTLRYQRYEEKRARGRRHLKPVWKPFWIK